MAYERLNRFLKLIVIIALLGMLYLYYSNVKLDQIVKEYKSEFDIKLKEYESLSVRYVECTRNHGDSTNALNIVKDDLGREKVELDKCNIDLVSEQQHLKITQKDLLSMTDKLKLLEHEIETEKIKTATLSKELEKIKMDYKKVVDNTLPHVDVKDNSTTNKEQHLHDVGNNIDERKDTSNIVEDTSSESTKDTDVDNADSTKDIAEDTSSESTKDTDVDNADTDEDTKDTTTNYKKEAVPNDNADSTKDMDVEDTKETSDDNADTDEDTKEGGDTYTSALNN